MLRRKPQQGREKRIQAGWGGVVANDLMGRDLQEEAMGITMSLCRQWQGKGPVVGVQMG